MDTQPIERVFVIEDNILKGTVCEEDESLRNVGQNTLDALTQNADKIGQIDAATGRKETFGEMKDRSIRCALWLQKQGIGHDDIISYATDHHMQEYIPVLATFYVGAVFNAWDHDVVLCTAKHLIKVIKPKIMFAIPSIVDVLRQAAEEGNVNTKFVVFGKHPGLDSLEDLLNQQTAEEVGNFQAVQIKKKKQTATVLFSSGSTGFPKGVQNTYDSLGDTLRCIHPLGSGNHNGLWYSPLSWISCMCYMLQSVLTGATRIVDAICSPDHTCQVIEKYYVDWFFIAPSQLNAFCKSKVLKNYKVPSLSLVMTAGSKQTAEVFKEFQEAIPHAFVMQGYGMTELGGCGTLQDRDAANKGSVGVILPNVQIKVVNEITGETLPPNTVGELCFKSEKSMIGYYNNPEETKDVIDKDGWLHSGDKGYFNEEGQVFVTDKLKEVMKFRGHHVSPSELESILKGHPEVIDVAVVPVPHSLDGERPMAFVTTVPQAKVTEEELIELTFILGEYKKLSGGVKFLDEMPYTPSGKIKRQELKEMAKLTLDEKDLK